MATQKHVIVAKIKGVEVGREDRPIPTNVQEAVAIFGSMKKMVQYALRAYDVERQAKMRAAASGSKGRENGLTAWTD